MFVEQSQWGWFKLQVLQMEFTEQSPLKHVKFS